MHKKKEAVVLSPFTYLYLHKDASGQVFLNQNLEKILQGVKDEMIIHPLPLSLKEYRTTSTKRHCCHFSPKHQLWVFTVWEGEDLTAVCIRVALFSSFATDIFASLLEMIDHLPWQASDLISDPEIKQFYGEKALEDHYIWIDTWKKRGRCEDAEFLQVLDTRIRHLDEEYQVGLWSPANLQDTLSNALQISSFTTEAYNSSTIEWFGADIIRNTDVDSNKEFIISSNGDESGLYETVFVGFNAWELFDGLNSDDIFLMMSLMDHNSEP